MKNIIRFSFAIFILISATIYSQGVGSEGVTDARSLGMAKTFTSSTYGLYAVGKNPANLYGDSLKSVEFVIPFPLPNISASVGTNFITIDNYNYYFGTKVTNSDGTTTGRVLTTADKNNLKDIFKDGGTFTSDVNLQWFSVSVKPSDSFGTIAFSISDRISSIITLPNGLVQLALDGNTPKQVYNFNDTQFKALWLRKYAFTYSRELNIFPKVFKSFNVGVSLNIVQGFSYAALDQINTQLTTGDSNTISGQSNVVAYSAFSTDFKVHYDFDKTPKQDFSFTPFPTPAGSGTGFDFGINAKLSDVFSLGLSIIDIGSITWDKSVAQFSSNKSFSIDDITDQAQRDTLVNRLTGKNNGKYISSITTQMATAFHLGASYILSSKLLLAADYHQGFNDQPGNSKIARFSLGLDWHDIGVLNIRTGFSFGGFEKFNWGLGLGLDFGILEMNFGSPDFQYAFSPSTAKRITFAVDSKWKF